MAMDPESRNSDITVPSGQEGGCGGRRVRRRGSACIISTSTLTTTLLPITQDLEAPFPQHDTDFTTFTNHHFDHHNYNHTTLPYQTSKRYSRHLAATISTTTLTTTQLPYQSSKCLSRNSVQISQGSVVTISTFTPTTTVLPNIQDLKAPFP